MLCFICLKENLNQPVENQQLYGIIVMMGNFGATLLRCLWIAIFIERTVATIYRSLYEKKTKCGIILSIGLSLGCYLVTGMIEYCFFYNIIDLNYTQGFALIMDIMAISVRFLAYMGRPQVTLGFSPEGLWVVSRCQGRVADRDQGRVVGGGGLECGGRKADKLRNNSRKVGCLEQYIYFWKKKNIFKFINLFLVANFSTPSRRDQMRVVGFLKIPPGVLPMYGFWISKDLQQNLKTSLNNFIFACNKNGRSEVF
jgi:hypothetical protein